MRLKTILFVIGIITIALSQNLIAAEKETAVKKVPFGQKLQNMILLQQAENLPATQNNKEKLYYLEVRKAPLITEKK